MITKTILFKHTRRQSQVQYHTMRLLTNTSIKNKSVSSTTPPSIHHCSLPITSQNCFSYSLDYGICKNKCYFKDKIYSNFNSCFHQPCFLFIFFNMHLHNPTYGTVATEHPPRELRMSLFQKNKTVFNIIRTANFALTIRILFTNQLNAQVCFSRGSDAFRPICQFHRSSHRSKFDNNKPGVHKPRAPDRSDV
jgi:hypothetical protein